jgi:transposase
MPASWRRWAANRLSASRETLATALHGKVTAHHRFLLKQHLQTIEHLEQTVSEFEAQIEAALEPFRAGVECLLTIPGVSATAASVIIAEIGVDMSRFATAGHLRSWAGLCPQLNEKCRQGHVAPAALRGPVAQNRTGAVRLGDHSQQAQLSPRPVSEAARSARSKKGHPGGGRFYPYQCLLSAAR